jgi:hypothetical protein
MNVLITGGTGFIGKQIALIGKTGNVLNPIFNITAKVFKMISGYARGLLGSISGFTTGVGSASGVVGKFASGFGKVGRIVGILRTASTAIPIVGQVITVLQAAYGMITRLMSGMGFFDALGETLYDVFVGPFEMLVELLTKIPIIGDLFKPLLTIFPVIKSTIASVFNIFQTGWESIKELFSGKDIGKNLLNIVKMIGTAIFPIPLLILKLLMSMFPKVMDTLKSLFTIENLKSVVSGLFFIPILIVKSFMGIGPMLLSVLKGVGSMLLSVLKGFGSILYTVFIQPWVDAWTFISDLFVGKSNSTLGEGIIKGLIGVGSAILKIFTSPFETIFQIIMTGFTSIATFIQTALSIPFKIVGKLIGVDTGGIGAGAESSAQNQEGMISAIQETNQKLDTLIGLMMSGGIAVNLDGRKVSEQLAIASS